MPALAGWHGDGEGIQASDCSLFGPLSRLWRQLSQRESLLNLCNTFSAVLSVWFFHNQSKRRAKARLLRLEAAETNGALVRGRSTGCRGRQPLRSERTAQIKPRRGRCHRRPGQTIGARKFPLFAEVRGRPRPPTFSQGTTQICRYPLQSLRKYAIMEKKRGGSARK